MASVTAAASAPSSNQCGACPSGTAVVPAVSPTASPPASPTGGPAPPDPFGLLCCRISGRLLRGHHDAPCPPRWRRGCATTSRSGIVTNLTSRTSDLLPERAAARTGHSGRPQVGGQVRSASTIRPTISRKSTVGDQPSSRLARPASPVSSTASTGRTKAGSTRT